MSEWAFRASDDVFDRFFVEGPFSGPDLVACFGDRFPGNSSAIVYPHRGAPYTIFWQDLNHLTLHIQDRLQLPGNPTSCGPLEHIMARLLDLHGGCPWDRAQTPLSLLPYLLDESYEAAEALVSGDHDAFRDELGDVLFQVVFHSALESPEVFEEVVRAQMEKLVRRHPHVFGGETADTADAVNRRWESLKSLDAPRQAQAEWTFPSLVWAKRLSKHGVTPDSPIFQDISQMIQVYISKNQGKLEEILADAAWAVADVGRRHHQDAEWALWMRLAFASQDNDCLSRNG